MIPTNTDERIRHDKTLRIRLYFMLMMAVVYIGLGLFLILVPEGIFRAPKAYRIGAGALLVVFGLVRFVRIIRQNKRTRHDSY
ncbi:hypothetical protein F0P96_15015 [Hymenobacter busanensis]|uniref:Uncharacterized protein n=1 Tax=Hymenobacter busanensis TaxID=2607656 RepID=A0A7L4ZZK1_9BACT|nr:hypothetical protein [Hymenobacter busanensis]KAA9331547.1 hypothetical protein F0P96_15015 [Hymenobacter busanensis]QHJ08701.1 hypothetical protein GUY19_15950 [Hymenobacter busanensis]